VSEKDPTVPSPFNPGAGTTEELVRMALRPPRS